MRIIHTSDLHLGSPLTARLSPDKARLRRAELQRTFERIVERGKELSAEGIIIAGDIFDSDDITRMTVERFYCTVRSAPSIRFFSIAGNHDKDALKAFGIPCPENLTLIGDAWEKHRLGEVVIAGRSGAGAGICAGLELCREDVNIVILHGSLDESRSRDSLSPRELEGRNIDYLALGHYHSYSEVAIDNRCAAVYSGTPEGRGFDECGECGFVLLEIEGGRIRKQFIPFAKRKMTEIEVDLSHTESRTDIEATVRGALRTLSIDDCVRVVLTGSVLPEASPDTDIMTKENEAGFFHFEIKDRTRLRIDPEVYRYDRSLKGEFLRMVSERVDISPEEKERIIRCGIGALMGEVTE